MLPAEADRVPHFECGAALFEPLFLCLSRSVLFLIPFVSKPLPVLEKIEEASPNAPNSGTFSKRTDSLLFESPARTVPGTGASVSKLES